MTNTIKHFGEVWGVDYITARSVMLFLVANGAAKLVGKKPSEHASGRGRSSSLYEVKKTAKLNLHESLQLQDAA